jgi:hypothetical protein
MASQRYKWHYYGNILTEEDFFKYNPTCKVLILTGPNSVPGWGGFLPHTLFRKSVQFGETLVCVLVPTSLTPER